MGGTATKERRLVAARTPNEMVARHLLVLGEKPEDVAKVTGLRRAKASRIAQEIASFGDGPFSLLEIAEMLGTSYRLPFRLAGSELRSSNGSADLDAVRKFAERRLRRDAEQRARAMLFLGNSPRLAAIRGRISEERAESMLRQMQKSGIAPDSPGPFTVAQAELATGLRRGQLKNYCRTGRLGVVRKFGTQYVIERKPLEEFIAQDRRRGCKAATWDD